MRIVEIKKLDNGAHDNLDADGIKNVPEGWAVVPEGMETENFPFGDLVAEDVDGVMTVTEWTPGIIPEVETDTEPTVDEILNALLGVSE